MNTKAGKRYRQRMLVTMSIYLVLVLVAALLVKHGHLQGWMLYACALAPAVPVILVLVQIGRYLQEESDEYVRAMTVRALLIATGALMGTIVVNDFLRAFANVGALPAFTTFLVFFLSFGTAQGVQQMMNRGGGDE
jgi:ABC-type cobalamin transport system permease subunit